MAQDKTDSNAARTSQGDTPGRKQRIIEALTRGNLDQIRAEVEQLLQESPRDFEAVKFAAVLALQQHDLGRAHDLFHRAKGLAPDPASQALACAGLCETLVAGGHAAEAETHVRDALRLDAGNPEYHKLLARCYMSQGRIQEAIDFLQRTLASFPPAFSDGFRLHLAGLMMQAGRADDALSLIDAIGLPMAGSTDALMTKATLLQVTGRFDAAAECYRRVLQAAPTLPYHYAFMECLGPQAAGERENLRDRLRRTPIPDTRLRIDLNFALARAADAAGEADAAFQHLQEGNRLKRASLHYALDDDAGVYESIRGLFDQDLISGLTDTRAATQPTPIFIVGMPRSGTTLVEQILGAHPRVAAAGELPFMGMLAQEFMARAQGGRGSLAGDIAVMAEHYLGLIRQRSRSRAYVTDKMPLNFRHLGLIRLLFPTAPIIHCRRDAMDTCFSCYQQLFEGTNIPFSYDLQELAGFHRLYRDYMAHWQQVLPSPPFELHYERLVEDMEGETRKLLAYCGLEFDPACLDFHAVQRTVLTASAAQVRNPLYGSAVGKWRRYERHLTRLMQSVIDST